MARWIAVLWVPIASVHGIAAAYAWRMLPHGFTADHPRFWTNQVLPWVLAASALACVVALWRGWPRIAAFAMLLLTGFHVGMASGWSGVFPLTGSRPAQLAAVIAAGLFACAYGSLRTRRDATAAMALGAVLGLAAGNFTAWSQRGADPATHPSADRTPPREGPVPAWAHVGHADVVVDAGPARIELRPLLEFISRSPDRGWTALASAEQRHVAAAPGVLRAAGDETSLYVDARAAVPADVYSHLNAFTQIAVHGHKRLFLAFSPMPAQRIEVTFSEYPTGRPARFAYVDAARVLHVVEAESGEKGPFTELARGSLPIDAPLGITLFDEDRPLARIELADFAAQASTQISPTAGWGVAENAIEFRLAADRPDAAAVLFLTLASTSVGRGWDSVGHAAGVYRNRITVTR